MFQYFILSDISPLEEGVKPVLLYSQLLRPSGTDTSKDSPLSVFRTVITLSAEEVKEVSIKIISSELLSLTKQG